jgi:pyruvate kinase
MKRERRAKILATLGPASSERDVIERLWRAGADCFRINMSHTSHEALRRLVGLIRDVEKSVARPIGILADLQGPKLRIGRFAEGPVTLEDGATFVLDSDEKPGDVGRTYLPHPEILRSLAPGHRLLLDDGKVRLVVTKAGPERAVTRVEVGGKLSDRKGVSCPDTTLPVSALTPKDRSDLDAALDAGADWIALSFVQRPDDLAEVRKIARGRALVMAKIEKPQAIERLDEIIELADALMVARGDLGVEMPLEAVPGLQKRISRAARKAGRPVVVATQMLESMISAPVPTRAEVSDVATAVFEGADAVMLSAESAAGAFPVEAVATMNRIAEAVERESFYRGILQAQRPEPEATGNDAICAAARQIAETLNVAAIVCYTAKGTTAMRAARERPASALIGLSPVPQTARRLSLVWGVHAVIGDDARDQEDMVEKANRVVVAEGFAKPGQRILIMAGVPFGTPGATNLLRLAYVSADGPVGG